MNDETITLNGATAAAPPAETPPSLANRVVALLRNLREMIRDHFELAVLEAERAALNFTKLIAVAVAVCVLGITAWLALVASAIVWVTQQGVSWPVALVLAALANLAIAAGFGFWIRGYLKNTAMFPATLRQLKRTANDVQMELR